MAQNKKDKSKLSIEQLISLAKIPLKEKPKKQNGSMVEKFIHEEKLSTGTARIPIALIYDRYYKWCDLNHAIPVRVTQFSKELKFFFPKVLKGGETCYIMSLEGFNVSLENQSILKEKYKLGKGSSGARKKKKVSKEKKQQDSQSENSSSETKEESQT